MFRKIRDIARDVYYGYFTVIPVLFDNLHIISYLFGKGRLRLASNFIFIKYFVLAGGEGTGHAFYNMFGWVLELLPQIKTFLMRYPFAIEIEITNVCNKKCLICEHTYWEEPPRHLSLDDFKAIVGQFPRLKWVNMTGEGDAFMNPDYLKMIEVLKKRNVVTYLVDSFDLIDKDTARRIIELGVEGIWVSMDAATRETYEKIKKGCNFERTIANIKGLIEIKKEKRSPLPEISFRYIINKLNVQEMPRFVKLVRSLGDKDALGKNMKIEFAGLLKFKEVEHLFIDKVSPALIEATLEAARESGIRISFAHPEKEENLKNVCYCAAWMEPYIMLGGYVLPCCAVLMSNKRPYLREHCFGNLLKEPFKDIWFSKRYKDFRRQVPRREGKVPLLCAGCRVYNTRIRERSYGISDSI